MSLLTIEFTWHASCIAAARGILASFIPHKKSVLRAGCQFQFKQHYHVVRGRYQSPFCDINKFLNWRRKWQPTPVFLPGKFHDRGAWQATIHGVTKSQTQLGN